MDEMNADGTLALRRPLGGLTHLRQFDPHISDLVGVLIGEKPVLYMDFFERDWPYIRRLCAAFNLKYHLPESVAGKSGFHHDASKRMLLLGRDEAILTQAVECWRRPGGIFDWGSYLGYPECCVRAYGEWKTENFRTPSLDIVRWIYGHSDGAQPFPFLLNNVANYYSRLDSANPVADRTRYAAMMRLGAVVGVDVAALNVVSWHPCSYLCRESSYKARAVFGFLEENLPQWAARLKGHLAHPIIYFNKYEFVALRGTVVAPGIVESRGVCPPYSLLAMDIVRALNRARRIIIGEDGILVEPGKIRLENNGEKPLLLDFRSFAERGWAG